MEKSTIALQVKQDGDTEWSVLRRVTVTTIDEDKVRIEMRKQMVLWQYNYAPFHTARFHIVRA